MKKYYIEFDTIEELRGTARETYAHCCSDKSMLRDALKHGLIREAPEPSISTKQSPCNNPNHSDEFNC